MNIQAGKRRVPAIFATFALASVAAVVVLSVPAGATAVSDEISFRTAWAAGGTPLIDLAADVTLTCGGGTTPLRGSPTPITVDGHSHTLNNACTLVNTDHGVMRSSGSGAVTVQNITVSGGHAFSANGSGIDVIGAPLTINNSTFTNNVGGPGGSAGGGATGDGGALTVNNSTFSGNSSTGYGSALTSDTSITIVNSTISGNANSSFGDTIDTGGTVTVTNATITGNTSNSGTVAGNAGLTVTNSNINGNAGTALESSNTVTVTGSTLSGNGQGIGTGGAVSLTNSTVTANIGRGVVSTGAANLVYATVVGNKNPTSANVKAGGGLTSFGSVIAQPQGGGTNCSAAGTSKGFNFADDTSCGFPANETHSGVNPNLGSLANNGGATPTLLPQPASPLINAIPNSSCQSGSASGITTDQRGAARPDTPGGLCDIGAVEGTTPSPPPPPSPNPSGTVAASCGNITYTTSAGSIGGLVLQPIPGNIPAGIVFPCGLIGFTITGLTPGQTVTVTVDLPIPANQYYKFENGVWIQLTSFNPSATLATRGTFTLTDGGPFDSDGSANGTIVDPGAPAQVAANPPATPVAATPQFTG